MSVTLRRATPLDAGAVGVILTEFAATTPWMPKLHSAAEDVAFAGTMIDRGWVRVAEDDRVVGFIARDDVEVNCLYLTQAARGQGIGSTLLNDAKAATGRLELWTFQANDGARRFYARHGFSEVEHTDGTANDEKLPDVRLVWEATT